MVSVLARDGPGRVTIGCETGKNRRNVQTGPEHPINEPPRNALQMSKQSLNLA